MRRLSCAIAATLLLALPACGGEDSDTAAPDRNLDNPQQVPISAVVGNPGDFERVTLVGTAYRFGDLGFALAGDGAALFVTTLPSEAAKIDDGETINVQGSISEIDAGLAELLANASERTGGFDRSAEPALAGLSLEEGAPAIENPNITGEQGGGEAGEPGQELEGGNGAQPDADAGGTP